MFFIPNPIFAPIGAKVNTEARNRASDSPQAPELGRSPYSYDPGSRHWLRSKAPATPSPDLWRDILGNRNAEGSLVTVGELRELVGLVEPALLLAEQQGAGLGAPSFWVPRSWARMMTDRTLAATYMHLATIKDRLGGLLDARNLDAVDDHLWFSAFLADVDEEVLLRLRRQGNPLIGDGSRTDALQNHIARNRGRMNWIATTLRSINAEGMVQA